MMLVTTEICVPPNVTVEDRSEDRWLLRELVESKWEVRFEGLDVDILKSSDQRCQKAVAAGL